MATFSYIATDGSTKRIDAPDANSALSSAPDLAPHSGVQQEGLPQNGSMPGTAMGAPKPQAPLGGVPENNGGNAPTGQAYPTQGLFGPNAVQNAPQQFQGYLQTAIDKLNTNSDLMKQRNLIIKHLYDHPLNDQEKSQLTEAQRQALDSNNRPNTEMQLRLINDSIAGRRDTMAQSLEFLTNGYNKSRDDMEKQRQDAINNVIQFAGQYGANAPTALKQLYGDDYIKQLSDLGIDVNNLSGLSTVAEQKAASDAKNASGLTGYQQQQALNAINDDFRQDPAVQQYTQSSAGWSALNSIDPNTTSPADDIAAIYSFAKIMDPGSVVREGEYATVQKYAQSWAEQFGFKAARIFSNTQFLSADALSKLKAAAQVKQKATEDAYNNSRKNFQNRISQTLSGQLNYGLPDYGYDSAGGDAQSQIESAGYDYNALKKAYPSSNDDELLQWVQQQQ